MKKRTPLIPRAFKQGIETLSRITRGAAKSRPKAEPGRLPMMRVRMGTILERVTLSIRRFIRPVHPARPPFRRGRLRSGLFAPAVSPFFLLCAFLSLLVGLVVVLTGLLADAGRNGDAAAIPTVVDSQAVWKPESLITDGLPAVTVPVYLTKQKKIDQVSLEEYVRGVVAAEMPIEFEPEALKAQALAARTYIVRRLTERDFSGVPVKDAWVTDTVKHQVYMTGERMKEKWTGPNYLRNLDKLNRAVNETRGKILTYEGKPINAVFFSTANGYTENASDYWSFDEPYLRSVATPWDRQSPEFRTTVTFTAKEFAKRLGLNGTVTPQSLAAGMKVLEVSEGRRIKSIRIGGRTFSGREVREKLGLRSSQFQWKISDSSIEITTFGYGHGVGMSQWGANGMALEGKTAAEIVRHYYRGIEIGEGAPFLQTLAVR